MPTYPDVPLGYKIEVAGDADSSLDPDDYDWTDVTNDLSASVPIKHRRGGGDEQGDSTSESSLTWRNPDARWSTDNPLSDMWPSWDVDCPIRCSLSLDGSSTWHELFTSYAADITDTWGGTSDKSPRTAVRADGVFRRVGQGDALRSALTRALIGYAVDDYQAVEHWAMEEPEGGTRFAASLGGTPATFNDAVTLAGYSGYVGSLPVPVLESGGVINIQLPVHEQTDLWQLQHAFMIPSTANGDSDLITIQMAPGNTVARIVLSYLHTGGPALRLTTYDAAGAVMDQDDRFVLWQFDTPYLCAFTDRVISTDHFVTWNIYDLAGNSVTGISGVPDGPGAGATGMPRTVTARANAGVAGWVFGQVAFYAVADIVTPNLGPNAQAAGGYDGEMAHERIARILRELRIPSDITATESTRLGPQQQGTAMDVLRACEAADHGQLDDSRGRVAYRALSQIWNQAAALTIDAAQYELGWPVRPTTDDLRLVNRSTVKRIGGSEATVDRSNGKAPRTRDAELNLHTDEQTTQHAAFYVGVGSVRGKRVPQISINLRAAPQLAAAVLALRLGDRVTVTNCPATLSRSSTLDLVWIGWAAATVSRLTLTVTANCVSYEPYRVGVYDTDRYGSRSSVLAAAVDADDTTWYVGQAEHGRARFRPGSSAPTFPATLQVGGPGGLTYSCSAIASAVGDGFPRNTSNGWGTEPSSGSTWTVSGTASDYSTTTSGSGMAGILFSAASTTKFTRVGPFANDMRGAWFVRPEVNASGGPFDLGGSLRNVDASNRYEYLVRFEVGGTTRLRINRLAGGTATNVADVALPYTYNGVSEFVIIGAVYGDRVQARAYPSSATDPMSWHADVVDSSPMLGSGQVGAVCRVQSGNTNVPFTPHWTSVEEFSPQRVTVVRLGAGADRAWDVDTPVDAFRPAHYALGSG